MSSLTFAPAGFCQNSLWPGNEPESLALAKQMLHWELWEYSWSDKWSSTAVGCNRFFYVCVSTGHAQWGVLAGFGVIVAPRIVSRNHVDVTDFPPSSNHCVRMLGRWWTSLSMKMVRTREMSFVQVYFNFVHLKPGSSKRGLWTLGVLRVTAGGCQITAW